MLGKVLGKYLGEYNFFQEHLYKTAKSVRQASFASGNFLIINHQIL